MEIVNIKNLCLDESYCSTYQLMMV